ncbi:hypothetical protein DBR43_32630 [Pedobacter sp. KBW06]|uniref:fasciclin domain-containing protein n=1 Tax=Pedobacter sp. KBW06 TaxID=2153359 RepID=UPI000F59EC4A|nr:fasciclin domain-containing protein [Pedobacter sp. KBW06]RQO64533.1 hypothetical protein DBR43_32630 [Pedobacter sp. KBW06]
MKLHLLIISMMVLLLSSCSKKEFMPAPEGENIPYHETKMTIQENLESSAYTCFYTAWRKSNMDKILKALNPKIAVTVFVPDNKAFEALGYNIATINRTPAAVLDSLLLFHTAKNQILPETLDPQSANYLFLSLLENKKYIERYGMMNGEMRYYLYRHYFNIENNNVLINGKVSGKAADIMIGTNGTLIPINKVLSRPVKDMRQTLEEDGRFGLYLSILAHDDEFYKEISSFPGNQLDRFFNREPYVSFSSVFAPTDEAFHKAGIHSLADVEKLNSRSVPYILEDYFTVSNYLPVDSVLNNHFWQYSGIYVKNTDLSYNSRYISPEPNPICFFSNDLKNEILGSYVTLYNSERSRVVHLNNLDFIRNGTSLKVRVKGSDAEPATVIASDIQTFNGTIHVVDRLLIPKGFKF